MASFFALQWQGDANLLRAGTRNSTFASAYIKGLLNTVNQQNQMDMVKFKVQEGVINAFNNYMTDSALHTQGLTLLMELARDSPAAQRILLKEGVHREVLNSMSMHRSNAGVQRAGCGALRQLLQHYDGEDGHLSDELVKSITAADVHTAILKAMKKHSEDLSLQHRAINALWSLAESVPSMKLKMVKDGTHVYIMQAMKRFPDNDKLIFSSVGCIREFVKDKSDNAAQIAACLDTDHVTMELQKAMKQFPNDSSIQEGCKMAMEEIEATGVQLATEGTSSSQKNQSATGEKKKKFGLF